MKSISALCFLAVSVASMTAAADYEIRFPVAVPTLEEKVQSRIYTEDFESGIHNDYFDINIATTRSEYYVYPFLFSPYAGDYFLYLNADKGHIDGLSNIQVDFHVPADATSPKLEFAYKVIKTAVDDVYIDLYRYEQPNRQGYIGVTRLADHDDNKTYISNWEFITQSLDPDSYYYLRFFFRYRSSIQHGYGESFFVDDLSVSLDN